MRKTLIGNSSNIEKGKFLSQVFFLYYQPYDTHTYMDVHTHAHTQKKHVPFYVLALCCNQVILILTIPRLKMLSEVASYKSLGVII